MRLLFLVLSVFFFQSRSFAQGMCSDIFSLGANVPSFAYEPLPVTTVAADSPEYSFPSLATDGITFNSYGDIGFVENGKQVRANLYRSTVINRRGDPLTVDFLIRKRTNDGDGPLWVETGTAMLAVYVQGQTSAVPIELIFDGYTNVAQNAALLRYATYTGYVAGPKGHKIFLEAVVEEQNLADKGEAPVWKALGSATVYSFPDMGGSFN